MRRLFLCILCACLCQHPTQSETIQSAVAAGTECEFEDGCPNRPDQPRNPRDRRRLTGTVITQSQKIAPPNAAVGDNFGYAVAISGDVMVVGAWSVDSPQGNDAGTSCNMAHSALLFDIPLVLLEFMVYVFVFHRSGVYLRKSHRQFLVVSAKAIRLGRQSRRTLCLYPHNDSRHDYHWMSQQQ